MRTAKAIKKEIKNMRQVKKYSAPTYYHSDVAKAYADGWIEALEWVLDEKEVEDGKAD